MTAKPTNSSETNTQSVVYIALGLALSLAGVWWALWGTTRSVEYELVEGISVFAVLYIIAQGVERVSELAVAIASLLPGSPQKRKNEELLKLRKANSTLNGNPTLADFGPQLVAGGGGVAKTIETVAKQTQEAATDKQESEEKVKEARRDIALFAGGLSIVLCALATNALDYGLLEHVGAQVFDPLVGGGGINPDHDRLLTALAAAGGTKALHELIGRVQKAKESTEAGEK